MFLLAYQISNRVLDRGKELVDQEITPRLQQKVCLRSLKPDRIWDFQRINSSASGVLQSWLSRATNTVKHALSAELLTTDLLQKFSQTPFYMGNLQNDLQDLSSSKATQQGAKPTHLVLMVNGLFGAPENWNIIIEELQKQIDASDVLLLASNVLGRTRTFEGIDTCGARVAEEVEGYIKQHPSLNRISVIGHSMGGLVARYLIGKLYDPDTCQVAGLKPIHFITLATPHLGCDGEGPAQVPFIGWSSSVPVLGALLQPTLRSMATPVAALMFRRTGEQFFLSDASRPNLPLLVRMTRDVPGEGYFFSALESFLTRTAYANSSGDHLVGWANSSLRHPDELPELDPNRRGRGVIRQDPPDAAFAASLGVRRAVSLGPRPASPPGNPLQDPMAGSLGSRGFASFVAPPDGDREQSSVSREEDSQKGEAGASSQEREAGSAAGSQGGSEAQGRRRSGDRTEGSAPSGTLASRDASSQPRSPRGQGLQRRPSIELQAAENFINSSAFHLDMLARLQKLSWRRIDTCFKGTSMPFFAHNLIQVTRVWINWEGRETCRHLASEFARLDRDPRVVSQLPPPGAPPRLLEAA